MKTFGIKHPDGSVELVSLLEDQPLMTEPYDVRQLCPAGRFWSEHPHAPWNAWWSPFKEEWVMKYPVWADTPENDPAAPWQRTNEPSSDPADYPDQHWTPPVKLPLVKLPQPDHDSMTHRAVPLLVWHDDRVERDWTLTTLP